MTRFTLANPTPKACAVRSALEPSCSRTSLLVRSKYSFTNTIALLKSGLRGRPWVATRLAPKFAFLGATITHDFFKRIKSCDRHYRSSRLSAVPPARHRWAHASSRAPLRACPPLDPDSLFAV